MTRTPSHIAIGSSRRVLIVLVIFLVTSASSFAQRVASTQAFDEGTRLLNSGDFRGAIASFEQAEGLGLGSSALFHNRAIAHFRLDEIGQSIQYLERAALISKNDPRIVHSLEIVSTRVVDTYSELPVPISTRFQRLVLGVASERVLMFTGIGFYLILSLFLFMSILGYWTGAWHRRIRVIGALASAVLISMALASSIWPAYPSEAVVLVEEADLYDQPDTDSEISDYIHEGLVVGIVSEGDDWALVQLPNGARGWILTQQLGAI
ncbi:MAG: hypothetical protein BMS9Abin05_0185 [Rhodothermia bacterium]|nr:MAG: hypothetical protein BMS9Abin05_0185 [Rhodothermia bacterium]